MMSLIGIVIAFLIGCVVGYKTRTNADNDSTLTSSGVGWLKDSITIRIPRQDFRSLEVDFLDRGTFELDLDRGTGITIERMICRDKPSVSLAELLTPQEQETQP